MDKKKFNEMMNVFIKVYEKGLTTGVLKIYFELFKEIPDNQVDYITRECLKRCHFFPRPADVFDYYDDSFSERREMRKMSKEEMEKNLRGIRKSRQDFERIVETNLLMGEEGRK